MPTYLPATVSSACSITRPSQVSRLFSSTDPQRAIFLLGTQRHTHTHTRTRTHGWPVSCLPSDDDVVVRSRRALRRLSTLRGPSQCGFLSLPRKGDKPIPPPAHGWLKCAYAAGGAGGVRERKNERERSRKASSSSSG